MTGVNDLASTLHWPWPRSVFICKLGNQPLAVDIFGIAIKAKAGDVKRAPLVTVV